MAISYVDVTIVTRGQSTQGACTSVAKKAAYISGEKISCEYTDETYFYPRKHREVIFTEIFLPDHAPKRLRDRATLWNEVECVEPKSNSQLAREVKVALQRELSQEQNIALAQDFARGLAAMGMVADLCIHDAGKGNPHAHILVTMRPFTEDGAWGLKSREEFLLDEHGQKIRLPSGRYKSFKVRLTNWDDRATLLSFRQLYEDVTNEHLDLAGVSTRISVKSYVEQGIEREPMVHLGPSAHALEQQGVHTSLGDLNREREKRNRLRDLFLHQFDAWVKTAKERLKQEAKQRDAQEQEIQRQVAACFQKTSKYLNQQPTQHERRRIARESELPPHREKETRSFPFLPRGDEGKTKVQPERDHVRPMLGRGRYFELLVNEDDALVQEAIRWEEAKTRRLLERTAALKTDHQPKEGRVYAPTERRRLLEAELGHASRREIEEEYFACREMQQQRSDVPTHHLPQRHQHEPPSIEIVHARAARVKWHGLGKDRSP